METDWIRTKNWWQQMKLGVPPAKCQVNGHLIEQLDLVYNYHQGMALAFMTNNDDKAHIEHGFLGTKMTLQPPQRQVYIDLGKNYFETRMVWFNTRYPCDFMEVHAFKVDSKIVSIP